VSLFFSASRFLRYALSARNQHFIHPPFAYTLYDSVITGNQQSPLHHQIAQRRAELSQSKEFIQVTDFGAGSKRSGLSERKISDIARFGISKANFSNLFYRLGCTLENPVVFELGTSIGLNTLYLSSIPNAKVYSLEGCPQLARLARDEFQNQAAGNIHLQIGNIDETLPDLIKNFERLDMVLLDANHRLEPTLKYFELCLSKASEECIFVFDDIHWSAEMEKAWAAIKQHHRVTLTMDLFKVGLAFIRPLREKQHYTLWY